MQSHQEPGVPAWPWMLALVSLVVITFVAYLPVCRSYRHDPAASEPSTIAHGFIWDDDSYLTNNPALQTPGWRGLGEIWFKLKTTPQYYPLVFTTFWIESRLWDLDPQGYHIVNVALHSLGCVILCLALLRLGFGPTVSWLIAAMFALHPVHVESVCWISERKNVLSALFYFAALLAYLHFDPVLAASTSSRRNWLMYGFSLVLFLAALTSKTVTCSLPAAILLIIWWKRGSVTLRDVLPTIPMFVLGLFFATITSWMEKHHVGAEGSAWNYSLIERFLIAGRVVWFYAGKIIWPTNLAFIYPRWTINAHQWWQWLYPLAAIALVAGSWIMRGRIGIGPLVAILFFGGTLLPALGFFNVYPFRYSFVADHFQHLASLGLIVLIIAGGARVAARLSPGIEVFALGLTSTLLLVCGVLTFNQSAVYRNVQTLWEDTLAKNPNSYMPHYNLAKIYSLQGESDKAIEHFKLALNDKPDLVEAMNNLGLEYAKTGHIDLALEQYQHALRLKPDFIDVYNSLGAAYALQNQSDKAIETFHQALARDPDFLDPRINLGIALARTGQVQDAEREFRDTISRSANNPTAAAKAHYNLAFLLEHQHRLDEAIEQYALVTQIDPQNVLALAKLGRAYRAQGQLDKAIACFGRVLDVQPGVTDIRSELAQSLAQQGQFAQALEHMMVLPTLRPNDPRGYAAVARYLIDQHDPAGRNPAMAIQMAERASQLAGTPLKADMLALWAEALAENDQFTQAVEIQQRAITQARMANQTDRIDELERHLATYRSHVSGTAAGPATMPGR